MLINKVGYSFNYNFVFIVKILFYVIQAFGCLLELILHLKSCLVVQLTYKFPHCCMYKVHGEKYKSSIQF